MDSVALASLLTELFVAIHDLAGYPKPAVHPEIHQVAHAVIEDRFCHGPCQVKAYYTPTEGVVIDEKLDFENDSLARSILFHELMHHVQAVSGRYDSTANDCVRHNRAEAEAYYYQNRYLASIYSPSRVAMTGWAARCTDDEVPTPGK